KRVIERSQIWIDLALEIPRKKPELFSRLDRRTGKDNTAHFISFKSSDRHCHCEICLSGSRRSESESDHFIADGVHIFLLSQRLRFDRLSLQSVTDKLFVNLYDSLFPIVINKRNSIVHVLLRDHIASL